MSRELDISFRQLEQHDSSAASALLDELGYRVDSERLSARIGRMRTSSASLAFVAVNPGGEIVGLASLHRIWLLTEDAPLGLITSLVVAEASRGQGIGRRLVQELCDRARELGCERLALTTHLRRADAHAFYERMGFEFTGRRYVLQLADTS